MSKRFNDSSYPTCASIAAINADDFFGMDGATAATRNIKPSMFIGSMPFLIKLANLTVLTAGTPADIGSVTLPAWLTRFCLYGAAAGPAQASGLICIAESASGTLAGASFTLRDTASGAGNALSNAFTGPIAANGLSQTSGSNVASAGTTIFVNQTANSANAGTISVYALVIPLL
jgi:hypothetical protein